MMNLFITVPLGRLTGPCYPPFMTILTIFPKFDLEDDLQGHRFLSHRKRGPKLPLTQ